MVVVLTHSFFFLFGRGQFTQLGSRPPRTTEYSVPMYSVVGVSYLRGAGMSQLTVRVRASLWELY
jgi:hypothetical protein